MIAISQKSIPSVKAPICSNGSFSQPGKRTHDNYVRDRFEAQGSSSSFERAGKLSPTESLEKGGPILSNRVVAGYKLSQWLACDWVKLVE